MTQFLKPHCDNHNASHNGKLDVTVSIRVPGDGQCDGHDDHPDHGDYHPHLPDTGVAAGSYGSATESVQFTVDGKGRLTAAGETLITPDWNSIQHTPDTLAGYGITDALPASATAVAADKLDVAHAITATGDGDWTVTFDGSSDMTAPLVLANTGVVAGDYGSATESVKVTLDTKGRVTAAQSAVITPDWHNVQHTPDTLAGYGITDALSATATASAANKLASSHTLTATGDASWNVAFDGSADVAAPLTLVNTGVAAGTYPKVTVDTKGRVTAGSALAAADIPALDWSKITTGKPTTRAGYGITDAAPVNSPVFTGQVTIPEGTQSSPGLTFANDGASDTGLWHIADGSFGVTSNGVEAARFTPSGTQFAQTPTAPTAVQFDNSTRLATTAFVKASAGQFSGAICTAGSRMLTAADVGKTITIPATPGPSTVTLPLSSTITQGAAFYITNWSGSLVTIQRQGQDTLIGPFDYMGTATSCPLQEGDSVWVVWNGGIWEITGQGQMSYSSQFDNNLSSNGYQKLPGGLIMQWGSGSVSATTSGQTLYTRFPTPFQRAVLAVTLSNSGLEQSSIRSVTMTVERTGDLLGFSSAYSSPWSYSTNYQWIALGY